MVGEVKKMQDSERGSEKKKEKSKGIGKRREQKVLRGIAIWVFLFHQLLPISNSFLE